LAKQAFDLALLAQGLLKGAELTAICGEKCGGLFKFVFLLLVLVPMIAGLLTL
jgi:hypothetical protein